MTGYKIDKMLEIQKKLNEITKQERELKNKLNKYTKEYKEKEAPGRVIYKNCIINLYNVHRERLDSKKLKKENFEIYKKYIIKSDSKAIKITIK